MEIDFRGEREAHLKNLCAEMGRSVDDVAGEEMEQELELHSRISQHFQKPA